MGVLVPIVIHVYKITTEYRVIESIKVYKTNENGLRIKGSQAVLRN